MKKILTFFIIIFFSFVNVYTQASIGQSLENFTKKEKEKIYNAARYDVASGELNIFDTLDKVSIYNRLADKIAMKKRYLEAKREKIIKRIFSLEETIKKIDEDIEKLRLSIIETNKKIIKTNNIKNDTKKDIIKLKQELEKNKKVLIDFLVYLYKQENITKREGKIDLLKTILFSNKDTGEVFSDQNFDKILEITGKRIVNERKRILTNLFLAQIKLNQKLEKLKILKRNVVVSKAMLEDKKAFKQELLESTKGKDEVYQKMIKEKLKQEQKMKVFAIEEKIKFNKIRRSIFEKYGCRFIDLEKERYKLASLKDQKCIDLNKIMYAENKLRNSIKTSKYPLDWPIYPDRGISAYFMDPGYFKALGGKHYAVDIRAFQATEIKAPADGYVIYLKPPVNRSYAYLALKHANGLVTVYGHISKSFVKKYDYVKAGQVIALSGGASGTLGAGYITSGPHLHFEVLKDKKHVDPLSYMDLSVLTQDQIPAAKYITKYIKDYKDKYGKELKNLKFSFKGFKLIGKTEVDRQKYLLNKYATKSFRDWNTWVEESLDGGLDPSFVMCIGLAETGLGRHLKTRYNVGNVGNTDDGSTWSFDSPREGIAWMIKTLNNKHLKKYTKVSQLSRYGNKNGLIYASSSFNWHNNIIRCMGELKNEQLATDFTFRINQD